MKYKLLFTMLLITAVIGGYAQDYKPSQSQFMIRGYGHAGFSSFSSDGETESSFQGGTFAPIFLFKHSDKIMFEAELEFEIEDDEVAIGFEYANFNYIMNDYVTLRGGKFLLPFGTFMERLHPSWINRLSSTPLGYGHDGIAPSTGIGFELRGAAQVGSGKINYSLYTTNGPTLNTGVEDQEEAGILLFENSEDNNTNKAIGGRLGILPFSNSSVEVGLSFYSGKVGDKDVASYENVKANLFAYDFSFVKQLNGVKGIVDVKAQYNQSNVDDATYIEDDGAGPEEYTFDNSSNSYYTQVSYRPTMSGSDFIKNLEFVWRYSELNTPEDAEWAEESTQTAFGVNYWMSWRSVFKFTYQTTDTIGGHEGGKSSTDGVFVHWAIGF